MAENNLPGGIPLPDAVAGNFQDAMRWFNQMWAGGIDPAGAGRNPASVVPSMLMPTLDLKEIDKRIADLRSVEHWLTLNQGMLRTTIQALEMQRNTLAAWQSLGATNVPGAAATPSAGATPENAAFQPAVWWSALQQQFAQMAASASAAPDAATTRASAAPDAASEPPPDTGARPSRSRTAPR